MAPRDQSSARNLDLYPIRLKLDSCTNASLRLVQFAVHQIDLFTPRERFTIVNKMLGQLREQPLIDAVVDALRALPQLTIIVKPRGPGMPLEVDGTLEVRSAAEAQLYGLQVKARLRPSGLGPLISRLRSQAEQTGLRPLLVTEYVSPTLAEQLVAADVEFADAAGNAYLASPAAYVNARGHKLRVASDRRSDVQLTPSKLRVLFALLSRKALRDSDFRTVAEAAGVSLGTVSNAFRTLRMSGHVIGSKGRPRIADFGRALAAWETAYAERLRPSLRPQRFTLGSRRELLGFHDTLLEAATAEVGAGLVVGGELAAAVVSDHLRPATATVYTDRGPRAFMRRFRVAPSESGELIVMHGLGPIGRWDDRTAGYLADPILVRAELLTLGGERLQEVADLLLKDHITPREADDS